MMGDTPERIWAGNWLADVGETLAWDIGEWRDEPWQTVDAVEYVRASDYDALAAKLAEVEAERDQADKLIADVFADAASNNIRLAEASHRAKAAEARIAHLENHIEVVAKDAHKIMVAYAAPLPAVYRLGLEAAAARFDEIAQHDQDGIDYSELVGIPISNREQLVKSVKDAEMDANAIRALPTPTAAELMARINEGEKE